MRPLEINELTILYTIRDRFTIFCYDSIMKKISAGTVHTLPKDIARELTLHPESLVTWEDITPLARNEWICWIESARQEETRILRLRIACENLASGKRRPCCWAGCVHR